MDATTSTCWAARNSARPSWPGHLQDGEIAPVHHAHAHVARRRHEAAEMGVQFRRAAGDIERADALTRQEFKDRVDRRAVHLLGPIRAGIDVAMDARLIAAVP